MTTPMVQAATGRPRWRKDFIAFLWLVAIGVQSTGQRACPVDHGPTSTARPKFVPG